MKAFARILIAGAASAGSAVCAAGAMATPAPLTDGQLDLVTAGAAAVVSSTDAAAAGALALTGTTSNSTVVQEASPYPGNPALGPTGGATDGTAVAVGSNVGLKGEPPTSATTNVQTAGVATGNQMISSTVNQTVQGAGGVVFQAGWTFVYGAWIGL
jgi:hypothetical protein